MGQRDLGALQRFVVGVVRATDVIDARSPLAGEAAAIVAPSPRGMTPEQRLEVYREQYWQRHLRNVEEDYPTLAWVVGGPDAFRALAVEYLGAFPPRTWDLQRLGADVPAFVVAHPRWGRDPLARDAARLDWAFMEAFDAPDAPPFDPTVLATTPEDAWPQARLAFHPSLRTLALDHAAHALRTAVQRGEGIDRPDPSPARIVVHRDARCFLHAVAVEPLAFQLLEALRAGSPLGEACEAVARASGRDPAEVAGPLGGWFQQWTASGWIGAVSFGA
jgi:hypothetical protein